ncbi:hypothetical protein AHF37_03947 [Paragonimus kellicotti]|nr:hypothetical protein AHF37_03947 [Paragonimus kellicotti]
MLDNMSKVFLLKCPPAVKTMQADSTGKHLNRTVDYVKQQVELCRRILHIIRLTADRNELSTETWTKLLFTLLDVMNATMIGNSPSDRLDNSWLSNEKLIHTLFQKVMNSLTGTMAKLVYGVDLSNLPKDSKHVRGKRSTANLAISRVRPKSFTETVISHATSQLASQSGLQLPSLSHKEIPTSFIGHAPIGDKSGIANGELTSRPHHAASPNRTSLSAYGQNQRSGLSDWQHSSTKDASESIVIDPSRNLSRTDGMEDEDSYLFGVNATLNDVQAPLDDVDTLLSIPDNMSRSLTRSPKRIPKSGTLVRNHESEFLVLRRVASDLDEKFKQASPHSIHDPTCGMIDRLEEPVRTSMSDYERIPTNGRFFTSSDNLSVLSVGSVVDSRSRGHSMPRSSALAMSASDSRRSLVLPMAAFTSPPPPALAGGLDDDSSSAFSRSGGFGTSGRESVDEDVKRKLESSSPCRKRSDSTSGGFLRSPVDSYDRPPLHHTDTLTARSNLDLEVGVLQTPTKANRNLPADSTVPRCLLAGGVARGWTQESIVICWRRFLGLLGNVTEIQVVSNLEKVYVYFSELVGVLLKIQQNQPLDPVSNECVRPIANYSVPLEYILPSLFEILGHSDRADLVKLSALRTLTEAIIRPPDRPVNDEVIAQYYNVLHRYLTGSDQLRTSNEFLLFFKLPHTEALMMLTSLLCYPHHFGSIECLDVNAVDSIQLIKCDELPSRLLNSLVQTTLGNPNAETRCLSLAALAMHCVIELLHMKKSQDAISFPMEAILVLMGMMRFQDHSVALVAVEMVYMLAHFGDLFLDRMPKLPLLIIRTLTWTLGVVWSSTKLDKVHPLDRRLLVTFILAITEWSLRLPLDLLLTPSQSPIEEPLIASDTVYRSVVFSVFSALYTVLCGTSSPATVPPTTVADGSSICENKATDYRGADPLASFSSECNIPLNFEAFSDNHGAQLNTLIQEHHDQAGDQSDFNSTEVAELSLSTLKNGNCQLFALNGSVLLTCLTLPTHVRTSPFLSNPNGSPRLRRSFATDLFNFNPFSCAGDSTAESATPQRASRLLNSLVQTTLGNPNAETRCLSLAALAMHCVIELLHMKKSQDAISFPMEAILVLMGMMRFQDHSVALVAVEMVYMLAHFGDLFLDRMPKLPLLIIRSRLLNSLVQTTLGNPNAETRCLSLAALAMHCVIELLHMKKSQDAISFPMEAILVLMGMMRFQDHSVALVAVEMVYMLAHFGDLFLDRMPKLPLLIIRTLTWTLGVVWSSTKLDKVHPLDRRYTRIIVRDFSGKYIWDMPFLHGLWNGIMFPCSRGVSPDNDISASQIDTCSNLRNMPPCPPPRMNPHPPPLKYDEHAGSIRTDTNSPTKTRPVLPADPTFLSPDSPPRSQPDDTQHQRTSCPADTLSLLLQELSVSSPECVTVQSNGSAKTCGSPPDNACDNMETLTLGQITAQCQVDEETLRHRENVKRPVSPLSVDLEATSVSRTDLYSPRTPPTSPTGVTSNSSQPNLEQFASCRHLLNQLGFLSFERRSTIDLVQKSAGLVRDLKHLDKFGVRETHKIAVFYVGAGQEDKQSILANQTASLEFENFVAGLGWEIDLLTHRGFRGGLEQSGRAGSSTPYYATATLEVIFHVSTRMPSSTQEDLKAISVCYFIVSFLLDRIVCNSAAQQGSSILEPAGASVRIRESVFELQQQSSITSIASPMMFVNPSITQPIVPGVRPGVMNKAFPRCSYCSASHSSKFVKSTGRKISKADFETVFLQNCLELFPTVSRSVLRTQFGDVLIVISPLPSGLFRVEVRRESVVGFFGPIVHVAVLDSISLPSLVRATAINASRAIRAMKPGYRAQYPLHFLVLYCRYEERAASLKQIISRYAAPSCFEDFAQCLVLPSIPLDLPWSWDPSNLSDLSEPHPATHVHREGLRPFVNFSPSVGPNYASDTRTEYVRPHGTQRRKHQSHSRVNSEYKRHMTNNQRIIHTSTNHPTQLISPSSAHHTPHLRNLFPGRSHR